MFKILKTIATELKRANDLKQRDIENKEKCNWYYQMSYHPTTSVPVTHFSSNGDNPFVAQSTGTYNQQSMSANPFVAQNTGTVQSITGNPYLDNYVKEGKAK